MKKYLLPSDGTFFKANMHCHSNYSDGILSPVELKELYKSRGYAVLAITDHEAIFDHGYLDDEEFLTIPGYEKEINDYSHFEEKYDWFSVRTTHLCIYPKDRKNTDTICFDPDFVHPKFQWMHNPKLKKQVTWQGEPFVCEPTVESINYILKEAQDRGYFVTLNHPEWSQQPYEMFSLYQGMSAMELHNTGCARMALDEDNGALYDQMLRSGHRILAIAADDNHNTSPIEDLKNDSFGAWIMIKAKELSHEAIMGALVKGDFYATTGPQIKELYVEDGRLHVETSAARKIILRSGNRYTVKIHQKEL